MKLKQLLAKSALAAGVGFAAFGLGGGLANAEPTPPPVPPVPDVPCVPVPGVGASRQCRSRRQFRRSLRFRRSRSRSGLIGTTYAPPLAPAHRRGVRDRYITCARSPYGSKLVPSRFHSTRPSGSTPRAINSRLRILLVAVVGRSSASQT